MEYNYHADHRTIAEHSESPWRSYDERQGVIRVLVPDEDTGDLDEEHMLPARLAVCPTCQGRGRYVNPSIDAGGISAAEFREDPDFAEDYFAGVYDVTCARCEGHRVIPVVNRQVLTPQQQSVVKRMDEWEREQAEWEAMARAERMMGA